MGFEGPVRPFEVIGGRVICPVGYKKFYPLIGLKGHNGYDFVAYHGEPVYHSGNYDGWMRTEVDKDGGIGVRVISNDPLIDGKHVQLLYWHLKSIVGYDKKPVSCGDLIGYADSTGASSGDHVHWAPKLCNSKGVTLNADNGYAGAFDPRPYFVNEFVIDVLAKKVLTVWESMKDKSLRLLLILIKGIK